MGDSIRPLVPYVQGLSLSMGSLSAYKTHINTLTGACQAFNYDMLSLSEAQLCEVVLFFALSRSIHSIDAFLSALSAIYSAHGVVLPRSPELKSLRRGLTRLFNAADTTARAHPLSKAEVTSILTSLQFTDPTQVLFGTWVSLSFLFALRPEDLERLRWTDVTFFPDGGVDITIQPGKGILFRGKSSYSSPATPSIRNPSTWLQLLAVTSPPRSPEKMELVFRFLDKSKTSFLKPITRRFFNKLLQTTCSKCFKTLPQQKISAYSLRRGGSSEYYNSGTKEVHLAHLMRHQSFSSTVPYIDATSSQSSRRNTVSALL